MIKLYLIILINLFILSSCNKKAEPETYLIPKGFTGRVNIILNQKEGSSVKYEGGRRIYEIPTDGILLTQFAVNDGILDRKYCYIDSAGNKAELPIYQDENKSEGTKHPIVKDNTNIGIFLDGTSGQYGNPPNAVWWQEFLVSNNENEKKFFNVESKKEFEQKLKEKLKIDISIP